MKYSCLILLATLVGTVSIANNNIAADAAPIARILAPQPLAHVASLQTSTRLKRRHIHKHSHTSKRLLNERAIKPPSGLDFLSSVSDDVVPFPAAASELRFERNGRPVSRTAPSVYGRFVMDERDDDAGNELLDTEFRLTDDEF
ncbi:MAG: hypothetical protein J3Q66DRAFT_324864 [Benniella sp.]|nr:MAG: hypothetical protein J3Q66DRAFT_324864 [Benniella sp.]